MTNTITINAIPSLGALVGVAGSDSLLRSINTEMRSSDFFGSINDMLSTGREFFISNVVRPIQQIGTSIKHVTGMLEYDEKYISIRDEEQLKHIPICMYDCILQYAPVKKLFDQGRIFGFGYSYVPDEDPYGRLISNGTVEDVLEAMDDKGEFELKYEFNSLDPELSFEELESIEETRRYIDWVLENSDNDFTDPAGNIRG